MQFSMTFAIFGIFNVKNLQTGEYIFLNLKSAIYLFDSPWKKSEEDKNNR